MMAFPFSQHIKKAKTGLPLTNNTTPRKEAINMASVQKWSSEGEVFAICRHNDRGAANPSNKQIDSNKTHLNYHLEPERDLSPYDYFKERKTQLYCYNRKDVVVMAGWVITAPKDLPDEQYKPFFQECYNFLEQKYGQENVIQSVVHYDEGGQPHLHFNFIPVVEDKKHSQGLKICANEVLNPKELRCFHPALQKHLNESGIVAKVQTGITKANGRNYTVKELKQNVLREREREEIWQW